MAVFFTDAQVKKVSLGNGRFLIGSPLVDIGPIKGNAMIDITRRIAQFMAGVPQIVLKQIAVEESCFFKATGASLDLNRVQEILGFGKFTSVSAGNIAISKQVITFDDPDVNGDVRGVLLGNDNVLMSPAELVQDSTDSITYVNGVDYTFDYTNGMITRIASGAIGQIQTVHVSYTYAAQNSEVYQFGGQNGVNFLPARFIHTRPDPISLGLFPRIVCDIYRATTNGKLGLEFKETEYNLWDFQFNMLADLTRQQGNLYFSLRRELAAGDDSQ